VSDGVRRDRQGREFGGDDDPQPVVQRSVGKRTGAMPKADPPPQWPGKRALTQGLLGGSSAEVVQRRATNAPVTPATARTLAGEGVFGASSALPHADAIQQAFGRHDITGVKAQVGGAAESSAEAIGASAYAQGDRVGFAEEPDLHTAAHEAAHVIQQRAGHAPVGGLDTPGDHLEQHADRIADEVVGGRSAERLLDDVVGTRGGGGSTAVQRNPPKIAPLDPSKPALHAIEAEDRIIAILERAVSVSDAHALQQRKRQLIEIFMAIPRADRSALWSRLEFPRSDDRLALTFKYRLATQTRIELLGVLNYEPTPLPTVHDSIEPEAFIAALDDTAIKLSPDAPKLAGHDVTTIVRAELVSALDPAAGHKTSLAWHLSTGDGHEYRSGTREWPVGPAAAPHFDIEALAGRSPLEVEIIVDGTVRKVIHRLLEVGPKAVAGATDLPANVVTQVHDALSRKLVGKHGMVDDTLVDEMLRDLAAIAPNYRAAVVAQLSGPAAGGDSLSALFYAKVPASVRPRVLSALANGYVEISPDAAASEVGRHPFELDVTPKQPVIAPWTKGGAHVKITPSDRFASQVKGLPVDGPMLEVIWTVDNDIMRVGEYKTTWQHGATFGQPIELELTTPGVHRVNAHFSQQGLVGQQIQVEVPVVMEAKSERAAADQMNPEQALAERAAIRAQMTADPPLTDWSKSDLWMRAAALDANLAAAGVTEKLPPITEAETFAPPSWLHHTGAVNPPLSTNRTHLRFLIEQRYKGPLDATPPISIALESYLGDGKTEPENITRARTIYHLVVAEESAMDSERTIFQQHFGMKGYDLCGQLLDQGEKEVYEKRKLYGIGNTDNPDATDNREALAEAALDLIPLQDKVENHEKSITGLETNIGRLQQFLASPNLDDAAALDASESLGTLQTQLAEEQKALETSENEFYLEKATLQEQFPLLGIANVGTPQKQRYDMGLLRKIAKGDMGEVATKFEKVLKDIAKVRGEINYDTVWSVPELLGLTRQALGLTPGTFQYHAVDYKLLEIKAGKIIKAISQIGAAILATILTFGAAGPLVFITNGALALQGFYELGKSIREYQFEKALTGTSYDKAKALSQDDPSTFWLAFEIVTTTIGIFDVATALKAMNTARKTFSAIRTARRAVVEIEDASKLARSLEELEHLAGTHNLSPGAQKRLRIETLEQLAKRADEVGNAARAMMKGSEEVLAKTKELGVAMKTYVEKLAGGKPVAEFKLQVLSEAEFEARFGSKKGRAVFVMEEGKPTVYARLDTRTTEIADEAAHVVQLGDAALASDLKYLDEAHIADWKKMSVSDKMEFFKRKLNVEIDAKQRILKTLTGVEERATAEANLADLEALQKQVGSVTDEQLAKMNAKILKEPEFLEQPSRAFGKRKVPVDPAGAPQRPDLGAIDPAATPPREVSKTKNTADYSSAYSDPKVKSVKQHGDVWPEHVLVTSGYEGKITSVRKGKNGATIVTVEDAASKKLQDYVIEAGADIDKSKIARGKPIAKDALIANEKPREYRWVEVEHADGTVTTRAEIRGIDKNGKVTGWIQRGKEGTERGAAAELAARTEADLAIAKDIEGGAKYYGKHVPHKVGGGGYDDVIVEFVGGADGLEARVRIREIKDYPNRHVPLEEFTALDENWGQNLQHLKDQVQAAYDGIPPKGFEHFTKDELFAIRETLANDAFEVEIRLGKSTKIGGELGVGKTLPALEARVGKKIDVKRIGEGDR
jgi:hypothetical protein